jgi:hypothetical protein
VEHRQAAAAGVSRAAVVDDKPNGNEGISIASSRPFVTVKKTVSPSS